MAPKRKGQTKRPRSTPLIEGQFFSAVLCSCSCFSNLLE
jgi:hypothetical protein